MLEICYYIKVVSNDECGRLDDDVEKCYNVIPLL
ncbi:MAG: hypothetical protein H6Q68_3965 [Firmicutes bacterium]|nr:hypothetical protein [Bacillota bacterium]